MNVVYVIQLNFISIFFHFLLQLSHLFLVFSRIVAKLQLLMGKINCYFLPIVVFSFYLNIYSNFTLLKGKVPRFLTLNCSFLQDIFLYILMSFFRFLFLTFNHFNFFFFFSEKILSFKKSSFIVKFIINSENFKIICN